MRSVVAGALNGTLAASCLIGGAAAAATSLPGPAFPLFANAPALTTACDACLADLSLRVAAPEKHAPDERWHTA